MERARTMLLSTLMARYGRADIETFKRDWPHDWLVWEPGPWRPPTRSTLVVPPSETAQPTRSGEGLAFFLEPKKQLTLGRGTECDLFINDATLSYVHLVLMRTGTGWTVRDSGSTNGTFLDGEKLLPGKPMALQNGARLKAGQVMLTYYVPAGMLSRLEGS